MAGEETLAWGPRDTFVVPSWVSHHHVARVETVLFSFSDRPVQEKLGLWRQGRGNHECSEREFRDPWEAASLSQMPFSVCSPTIRS